MADTAAMVLRGEERRRASQNLYNIKKSAQCKKGIRWVYTKVSKITKNALEKLTSIKLNRTIMHEASYH